MLRSRAIAACASGARVGPSRLCVFFPQSCSVRTTARPHSQLHHDHSSESLLAQLRTNPELDANDAQDELRWIREEVHEESSRAMRKGHLPPIEDEEVARLVQRRAAGEPLQYILGSTDFGPLTIKCLRPVLIPRPETAHCTALLSDRILSSVPPLTSASRPNKPLDILDLCTGSGCIALLLAQLNPLSRVRGIDRSPAAVSLANANTQALGLQDRVTVRYGNLFSDPLALLPESRKVGLVVSNPPYIPYREWKALSPSVRGYESPSALLGDGEVDGKGLTFYERIAAILPELLVDQADLEEAGWTGVPRVALEVGMGQAQDVVDILKRGGLVNRAEVWKDQWDVDRFVVGWVA
ncbi:hypothetical protein IAU60_000794 [Kwoniella sp. DSM 27419]